MKQIATKQDVTTSLAANGFNSIAEELEGVVESTGQTLDTSGESAVDPNTRQIRKAITAIGQVSSSCSESGSGNLFVLSQRGGVDASVQYYDGQTLSFFSNRANNGNVTCNYEGLGVRKVLDSSGAEITSGFITSGLILLTYSASSDGGAGAFILDVGRFVPKNGDSTIADVKTFTSSPIVPTPMTDDQAVNKKYVDDAVTPLPSVTGTATFTNVDQAISMLTLGDLEGLEVGDVIQVSGSVSNDTEFTVEDITDSNNIVVNYEHRGQTTSKALVDETSTSGVTVKLLAKWYNASDGLGQGWCVPASGRAIASSYSNTTGRSLTISIITPTNGASWLVVDGDIVSRAVAAQSLSNTCYGVVGRGEFYQVENNFLVWSERR